MHQEKLDRSKPFGRIAPPLTIEGFDVPAHYEQHGQLFDAHDRALSVAKEEKPVEKKADAPATVMSVEELFVSADTIAYPVFHKHAKAILGEKCPSGKKAILAALADAKKAYDERKAKVAAPVVEEPDPAAPAPAKASGVDLAAWGRGQKNYLFNEIQKAVRATYHAVLSERRDVLTLLIEQGVITAAEARKDVT